MKAVAKACYDRAVASGNFDVYYGSAPNSVDVPYTVFTLSSLGATDYESKKHKHASVYETMACTFNVFATNDETVSDEMGALWDGFESPVLTLDEGTNLAVYREARDMIIDPDPSENGLDVWHGTILFDIEVNTTIDALVSSSSSSSTAAQNSSSSSSDSSSSESSSSESSSESSSTESSSSVSSSNSSSSSISSSESSSTSSASDSSSTQATRSSSSSSSTEAQNSSSSSSSSSL